MSMNAGTEHADQKGDMKMNRRMTKNV